MLWCQISPETLEFLSRGATFPVSLTVFFTSVLQIKKKSDSITGYSTLRIDPHSMWSRAKNWINHLVMQVFRPVLWSLVLEMSRHSTTCPVIRVRMYSRRNTVLRSPISRYSVFPFQEGHSILQEITSKSSLILTNQEPVIDIAFPTLKKVSYIKFIFREAWFLIFRSLILVESWHR